MAKKNGRPFPLLRYVQRDAISSDVVILQRGSVDSPSTFSFGRLTQQQACANGSPASEESSARYDGERNYMSPQAKYFDF